MWPNATASRRWRLVSAGGCPHAVLQMFGARTWISQDADAAPASPLIWRHGAHPHTLAQLWHPSGGFGYHWRAWRFRTALWPTFRAAVTRWLATWSPASPELVLVGPNAGYCLPIAWLRRFDRLYVLEPDPLAAWILRRRLAPTPCIFLDPMPLVPRADAQLNNSLAAFFDAMRSRPILFCNVLGQLTREAWRVCPVNAVETWIDAMRAGLQRSHFLSFHDRCCFDADVWPSTPPAQKQQADCEALVRHALTGASAASIAQPLAVIDHRSDALFTWYRGERNYAMWQLCPRRWHVIEALAHGP